MTYLQVSLRSSSRSMVPQPKLAPELVDRVIDHLHHDKASLKACTLVSREWLNSSCLHLFKRVTVRGWSRNDFDAFRKYLVSSSRGLKFHTRDLEFLGHRHFLSNHDLLPTLCKHILQEVLSHLPRLRGLELRGVSSGCCDSSICQQPFLFRPPDLEQVVLCLESRTGPFSDHLDLLSLFGNVTRMNMTYNPPHALERYNSDWPIYGALEQRMRSLDSGPAFLRVNSLKVSGLDVSLIFLILCTTPSPHTLSSLWVEYLRSDDDVLSLGLLLQKLGMTLTRLHLDVTGNVSLFGGHIDFNRLRLGSCKSLTTLVLVMDLVGNPMNHPYIDVTEDSNGVLDALCTITGSLALRHVTFQVYVTVRLDDSSVFSEALRERMMWTRMDEILDTFPRLQKAQLVLISPVEYHAEFYAVAIENMCRMSVRGLLEVPARAEYKDDWPASSNSESSPQLDLQLELPTHIMSSISTTVSLAQHPKLAPELIDCIIDHLHDDRRSLKQCSLVAKLWLNSSYLHLFRSQHLARGKHDFEVFLRHLMAPSCRLRFYLRRLVLDRDRGEKSSYSDPVCKHFLQDVFGQLPRLKEFVCSLVLNGCNDACRWQLFLPCPKDLDHVTLLDVSLETLPPLSAHLDFLKLFGSIKYMDVLGSLVSSDTSPPDQMWPNNRALLPSIQELGGMLTQLRIQSLRCATHMPDLLVPMICASSSVQTLSSLDLIFVDYEQSALYGMAIQKLGSTLTHLHLDISEFYDDVADFDYSYFRLDSCSNLSLLTFTVNFDDLESTPGVETSVRATEEFTGMLDIISTLSGSSALRNIDFIILFSGDLEDYVEAVQSRITWPRLQRVSRGFSNLERVILNMNAYHCIDEKEADEALEIIALQYLPILVERGVLVLNNGTGAPVDISTVAPIVTLDQGTFVGIGNGNVSKFLGIPFAKPPVGDLRYRLPVPNDAYTGVQSAASFGSACPQQAQPLPFVGSAAISAAWNTFVGSTNVVAQSEDCLTVNVLSPQSAGPDSKLPVVMWIYGGSFQTGMASTYGAGGIIQRSINLGEPVVFVSFNYRLSGLGFLAGKEVNDAGVGNLGLQDQRLALRWIQKYITAFGGDPAKVTIWGQSAGAMSVSLQLLTNGGDAEGLFRGAIMESGSATSISDGDGQDLYDELVTQTGCANTTDTLECLRQAPFAVLKAAIDATPSALSTSSLTFTWGPRVDGKFLVDTPSRLILNGSIANVSFIASDVDDEGTAFALPSTNFVYAPFFHCLPLQLTDIYLDRNDTQFHNYVSQVFFPNATSADIDQVLQLYPADPTQGSPFGTGNQNAVTPEFKRIAAFLGDFAFQGPRRFILEQTAGKQDSWSYLSRRFKIIPVLGSAHGTDLTSAFQGSDLTDFVVNFVNHLDPNGPTVTQWPKYSNASGPPQLMTLNDAAPLQSLSNDTFRQEAIAFLNGLKSA
ncbi:hypothetical protein EIP91_002532 [Steccherinum ochraceum]|uniref:Carboxylesterase type B domain-containing protein n=1 Tax=Steccherinum ochraceum TaxID=92696 RepID=A0A4R0RSR5_9APHY|nr:hypothetical protein EIP91_002532 [Steccherinum ochraceum]